MEKILLALDPKNLNMSSVDFACYLSRLTHSRLTGVFLEDIYNEEPDLVHTTQKEPDRDHPTISLSSISSFKVACECRGVSTLVHRDRGVPADEIIEESRFADLVVVDAETSFARRNESVPGRFVKDVLLESECPIIISPFSFDSLDEIIFSYNGSKSSMFAIKQFTYLFPELQQKKAIIVSARANGEDSLEEQFKLKEWLKNHYNDVEFVILKGDPSDQLFGYLIERKNGIVVMGAYGRGMLSQFFRPSHAKLIVKTVNLPIFISHY
ncbi:MAG: universal stress protein [Puia sp.]|nr:universal stress protein [Puia sp.]